MLFAMSERFPITLEVGREDAGKRLDQFLAAKLPNVSRARVQQLIADGKVLASGIAAKASLRLKCPQQIEILGEVERPPLRAVAEEIPLDIVYEDDHLAVINKPSGMMVHAGAGATEDARNRGTLVNALLHRFGSLSEVGGQLRPGIVHRLDRDTSGLIVIAKNDPAHRALSEQFAARKAKKTYIALVHGWLKERGTINANISRDLQRRNRMTTRRQGGREAITHYLVRQQFDTPFGKFSLLEIKIDTGRTHQIRVHMASLGHPVVGDTLYGAPRELQPRASDSLRAKRRGAPPSLPRNFLHSSTLVITHPVTGDSLSFHRPLPPELQQFMDLLKQKD